MSWPTDRVLELIDEGVFDARAIAEDASLHKPAAGSPVGLTLLITNA